MTVKIVYWNNQDTPIPRKGEIIQNIFREKFRVIGKEKGKEDTKITLELVEVNRSPATGRGIIKTAYRGTYD